MMNAIRTPSFTRPLAGLTLLVLTAFGCGTDVKPLPKPVNITSFTAAPEQVAAGGSATLAWKVEGDLKSLEVLSGADQLAEEYALEGSLEVTDLPAGAHRYVLNAYGVDGKAKRAEVVVTAVDAPTVVEFVSSRTEAPAGTAVFLTWKTLLAESVELRAGTTVLETFTGAQAAAGSFTVRPTAETQYTLKATGLAGEDSKTLTVAVNSAPVFDTATIAPTSLKAGETATLTWATQRATSLTLKDGARILEAIPAAEIAAGSREIVVNSNRTFTLVAEGPGGLETTE